MFKVIAKYAGYFLSIAGAVAIIWKAAVFYDNRGDDTALVHSQLEEIIDTQTRQTATTDSVSLKLDILSKDVNMLAGEQTALRKSYIKYISNDDMLTKNDFLHYMEGLSVDLKKKIVLEPTVPLEIPSSK